MTNFYSKIQFLLFASLFMVTIFIVESSADQRFVRKYSPLPTTSYPKMRWPEEIMSIDDFDVAFDSLDDNETQEHFLEAFEELSPEIQETILYFYDENLKLTEQKMQLSYIVDYLLKVFPIKVEVYVQQQPISTTNPYNYNQYQQRPGPSSFYPPNPYGFGYSSVPFVLPMGLRVPERDERLSMQPRKFYRFQDMVRESINGEQVPGDCDEEQEQYSVEQIVVLYLLEQCAEYYEVTNELLPGCVLFINQLLEAVDKIKLDETLERINLRRSMHTAL